jgi:hypothetical protein
MAGMGRKRSFGKRPQWVESSHDGGRLVIVSSEAWQVRDGASSIEQARGIARKALIVLGFNALLCIFLIASGGMASPTAHGSPIVLGIGLASALVAPVAKIALDASRKSARDHGLYLGLIGTTLLWAPLYLLTMFGDQPDPIMDLTYVGIALLFVSILWPRPSASR